MRETWLFGGAFWGILLIVIGALFLLRTALNIQLPVFRIAIGLILIYFGLSVMIGNHWVRDQNTLIFGDRTMVATGEAGEFNVLFSRGTVDFTQLPPDKRGKYEINTIFGEGIVLLERDVPVEIKASSVFASTRLPDGSSVSFGENTYISAGGEDADGPLIIETNAVFGSLRFIVR